MTYAQLTLPRGKGYSPMIKQTNHRSHAHGSGQGTLYAKIDHSRSLFTGLLSPGSASGTSRANPACFAGPMIAECDGETEINSATPLVGKSEHYVIYSPETGQGADKLWKDHSSSTASNRESKV